VRTAAIPDAEPLPPLLPTTVGWRWPWLLATLVLTLTAGVLFVRTFPRVFQFLETTQGADYTAWVYRPLVGAFALSFVAGVVTMIVLRMRRWKQRTRNVLFAVFAAFSLAIAICGRYESELVAT
jgi:hypothetical protein